MDLMSTFLFTKGGFRKRVAIKSEKGLSEKGREGKESGDFRLLPSFPFCS